MMRLKTIYHGDVPFGDAPLCTVEQVQSALGIVRERQDELYGLLPRNHMWQKKRLHMGFLDTAKSRAIQPLLSRFCPENRALIEFLVAVHDLGRLVEAAHKEKTLPPGMTYCGGHAQQSVLILEAWGVKACFSSETWEVIAYAISNHATERTPEPPADPSDDYEMAKYIFTMLLRDLDKYAIFLDKTELYLYDNAKKEAEIAQHGFVGEIGVIDPADFVEQFERQQPLDRGRLKGASYEAYMLYFFSWLYDVNLVFVLEQIVATGAPKMLVDHFNDQLEDKAVAQRIEAAAVAYLAKFDLKLTA